MNDLHRTFGDIHNGDFEAFYKQLIEIQGFQTSRDASEQWVQHLRFLDISAVPHLDSIEDEEPPTKYRRDQHGHRLREVIDAPRWTIPLTRQEDDDGNTNYIAVSWKWETPQDRTADQSFDYQVQRPGHRPHKSDFPDHYLERVIRFAQHVRIPKIWIDKECIYQQPGDDLADKSLGIQIMDVVYGSTRCAYSAGLLRTSITKQAELDALAALVSLSIFVHDNDSGNVWFRDHVNKTAVKTIIRRLLNDPRWSRAWIFQEDHLSSDRMMLLIPCSKTLRRGKQFDFGTISTELLVPMYEFKKAVTMFCEAAGDDELVSEFLRKAKQYNIWNKRIFTVQSEAPSSQDTPSSSRPKISSKGIPRANSNTAGLKTYPSTTLSILEDICSRDLENEHDRIAILANAARFPVRLDVGNQSALIRPGAYSLSTALLALILLNGEILETNSTLPADESVLSFTLQDYLTRWQYKFIAPSSRFQQSFIDHCRLASPTITRNGVHVEGLLFRLLPRSPSNVNPFRFNLAKRDVEILSRLSLGPEVTQRWRYRKLSLFHEVVLQIVIERLRNAYGDEHGLSDFLYHQMELDRGRGKADPLTKYVLDNLSALAAAIAEGRDVRLARLEGGGDDIAPSAIFVAPVMRDKWFAGELLGETDVPPRVFVSWDAFLHKGWKTRGMERLASLEVTIDSLPPVEHVVHQDNMEMWSQNQSENHSAGSYKNCVLNGPRPRALLRSSGWVHGIWDMRGKGTGPYAFPLPGISDRI